MEISGVAEVILRGLGSDETRAVPPTRRLPTRRLSTRTLPTRPLPTRTLPTRTLAS